MDNIDQVATLQVLVQYIDENKKVVIIVPVNALVLILPGHPHV